MFCTNVGSFYAFIFAIMKAKMKADPLGQTSKKACLHNKIAKRKIRMSNFSYF